MSEDIAKFEGATEPPLPEGFEVRMLQRLDDDAVARTDATLERVGAKLRRAGGSDLGHPGAPATRSPLREPVTWLFGLGLAALAAALAVFVVRPSAPVDDPAPAAFVRPGAATPADADALLSYDAHGRVREIAPSDGQGERVVFRAGRVIRIEHLRGGQLDGVAVDFDADGGVVAVRTWSQGREAGPWLELDGHGRVTAKGER